MASSKKISKKDVQDILKLGPMQEGILFHYLSDPTSDQYFEQLSLNLTGAIDVGLLRRAWNHVVASHEMLRLVFSWQKLEKPVQIVLKDREADIREYDLTTQEEQGSVVEELQRVKEVDRQEKFDLATGPTFRITLCKLAEESYELIISNHHIIYDGWSTGVILRDFFSAYGALLRGEELTVTPKGSFKDYIKWMQDQDQVSQKEFWSHYLTGLDQKTSLPLDQKPVAGPTEVRKVHQQLSRELQEEMAEFTKNEKVTASSFFYTLWGILLHKYNNLEDVLFGTTVAGRPAGLPGVEEVVGLFINTIPLRVQAIPELQVKELLHRVQQDLQRRQDYHQTPLTTIKGSSQVSWEGSLFDSIVVVENYPLTDTVSGESGIKLNSYDIVSMTNFPLILEIDTFEETELIFSYDPHLFQEETIQRLVQHFVQLAQEMVEKPEAQLKELQLLSETEREQILTEFNQQPVAYPTEKTILELFQEQVEESPERLALVYNEQELTYAELNHQANRLARRLRELGVKPNEPVGILAEHRLEVIIGVLAILKAGGAYLPFNADYPLERVQFMLEDTKARILLGCTESLEECNFPELLAELTVISLEDPEQWGEQSDSFDLPLVNQPQDLIYIIYTSGSTGQPKGVLVSHQNVNRLISNSNMLVITEEERILATSSLTFDVSTFEIWGALLNGATLYQVDKEVILSPEELEVKVKEYGITRSWFTSALFNQLLDKNPEIFSEIKVLMVGGDAISPRYLNQIRQLYPEQTFINGYGPTECTTFATFYQVQEEQWDEEQTVPIGKPVSNTTAYVMDQHLNLLPVGVAGELCLGGDGVAQGYLNRPELTAEKFVANPFNPEEKLYRTGDLVKWSPEGNILFLGRIDHQVKIRGFRIELGEIETNLLQHQAVREVVITVQKDESDNNYLCAYLVADEQIPVTELRNFLSERLPEYTIPSYFVQLEEMPLNKSGKVDRKALPAPEDGVQFVTEYHAPVTLLEEKLTQIWSAVLDVERVGVTDNFFALGGHSLMATSLAAKVNKELEVELPLREIFKSPTIRELADYIQGLQETGYQQIEPIQGQEYYQLSSAQARILIVQQMDPETTAYNIPAALEISGELDQDRLYQALQQLVNRHEAFRTSFQIREGKAVQVISPELELELEVARGTEAEVTEIMAAFVRPFDLGKAPLLRVKLLTISPEQHLLLLDIHHIIADGGSMSILMDELVRLYQGESLPEMRIQYRDFAHWQAEFLRSDEIQAQEAYWLAEFSREVPVLNLPTDYLRSGVAELEGGELEFIFPRELHQELQELAARQGTTLYMVLLAAYNLLLAKYASQDDIVVGTPIAGRHHGDLAGVIGMFVNTLAMRNQPTAEKQFTDFLQEVKEKALLAYENQDYQFETLVKKLQLDRDLSRNPLFDTVLALQNNLQLADQGDQVRFAPRVVESQTAKFDLTVNMLELAGDLQVRMEYRKSLFKAETIQRIYQHLVKVCQEIVAQPDQQIGQIQLLSAEEREQILVEFNQTKVAYPTEKTIVQLLEEQVNLAPEKVALVCGEQELTYGELNREANRLARKLREMGVQPQEPVAILAEHRPEAIVGVVAILKAGGAYLPLDGDYPVERVRFMQEDTGVRILLGRAEHLKECNFPELLEDFTLVDLDEQENYAPDGSNLPQVNQPDDLIYIIYTSGSTGRPKGVLVTHQNVNRLISNSNMVIVDPQERLLSTSTLAFDASTYEIWGTLLNGATLYQVGKEIILSPTELEVKMKEYRIDQIFITSALFNQLLDKNPAIFSELEKVMTGGDIISPRYVNKIRRLYPQLSFICAYGPTECTTFATFYQVEKDHWDEGESLPIGKPISNTTAYITDANQNLLPVGVPGELCLGGDGVAQGYLNRSELTAEHFLPNPYQPGEQMYRTGDLVRWLPDGNIQFLGRVDHQVKIRGFRIELGEIELALLQHPAIQEVVVIAPKDEQENRYLVGYLVAEDDLTVSELREFLAERLPDYMIPSYFVQLAEMPLKANGKVDWTALPAPDHEMQVGIEYVAPVGDVEEKLAEIWSEILGVEKIGVDDNFFVQGGHSLLATALTAKVAEELEVVLPLREIFKTPTIRGLAKFIEGQQATTYTRILPVEAADYYPISSAQKRMYILNQMDEGSITYNIPFAYFIQGQLDVEQLEKALQQLVDRHEAFRTSFESVAGEPVQIVNPDVHFELERVTATDEELVELQRSFVRPFDLAWAPLFRARLVQLPTGYQLMLDMHHIIADGASMSVILADLQALYLGEELAPLTIQYKDVVAWQGDYFQSEVVQQMEEYWLKHFADEIPVLNLPTDHPRPAVSSFVGDTLRFTVGAELTQQLSQVALDHGATLFMTLLSAYHITLAKYSNQEDLITGSPIAGRNHADLNNVVGMLVNTLALRTAPEADKSYREYLTEVQETVVAAQENGDYQFEVLVEQLPLERDLSRNPLFDTIFSMQNLDHTEIAFGDLKFTARDLMGQVSRVDLSLLGVETPEGVQFAIEYSTSLFTAETIQRFQTHFLQILEQIAQQPEQKLGQMTLLTPGEREQIIEKFNDTRTDFPREKTVTQVFAEQVEQTPDQLAVQFEDQSLTYAELELRANQLALSLRQAGVQREDVVGLVIDRSLEMVISILAIIKAGGAYLPIDLSAPENRMLEMLEDAEVQVVLGDPEWLARVGFTGTVIDPFCADAYSGEGQELTNENQPADLIYVLYTSGSTGKPKGVMIEHRNVLRLLKETNMYTFTREDRLLQTGSLAFDASTWEVWGTLLNGASLYLTAKENILSSEKLGAKITEWEINVMFLTTALFHQMVEMKPEIFGNLQAICFGGEKASAKHVYALEERYPYLKLINGYGPTEGTTFTTSYLVHGEAADQERRESLPIGKPLANTTVYVVDQYNNLQPVGVPGELCIAGEGLGRGYLNRPELTAEKLVPNPFVPGTRMYRSGDLVRWLSDGNLEFIGRLDHQVKIRGFRIEPGEIEAQLLQYPAVQEVVVIDLEDASGIKYLCAYLGAEGDLEVAELKAYLAESLPDYMIPAHFMIMVTLPLNTNGKVDRRALPKPEGSALKTVDYVAPTNEIEEKLAQLWTEILEIEPIGIDYNFFELGGHSLRATTLVTRVYKELQVNLPLQQVFKTPTIRELARVIQEVERVDYGSIQPVEKRDYYPVSSAQRRLFILDQLEEVNTSYNVTQTTILEGQLDLERLERALQQLVQRHEALRTSFGFVNGEPVQYVHDQVEYKVDYLTYDPEVELDQQIANFVQPFDLTQAPLVRTGLIPLAEDQHLLIFDIHHVIADGTSSNIMVRDFVQLYQGVELPALRVHYKDFSLWQNDLFGSEQIKVEEKFWSEEFADEIPVLNLPTDYPRPSTMTFEGGLLHFAIPEELKSELKQLAQANGATLYMVLLAAFNTLLARYSGQEDIVVGSPIAGRPHTDLENVVGMFVNTLAMRNDPVKELTFAQFLTNVRDRALQAYEHQNYQFEMLVDQLELPRTMSRNPLFDVMFVLQNMTQEELEVDDLTFTPYEWSTKTSKFDLLISGMEVQDGIEMALEYSSRLFKRETMERLIAHFVQTLKEVAQNPQLRLGEIELMDQAELERIAAFNQTESEYPREKTIHQLFEEQVAQASDQQALYFEGATLTYGELNARANQLAGKLRRVGVGPNQIVGVMLERSLEMVIGALAVLKAGGAYLPIAPDLPDERVAGMLADSRAVVLLTTSESMGDYEFEPGGRPDTGLAEVAVSGELAWASPITGPTVVRLDQISAELEQESPENLAQLNQPDDLLYLINTSGSTGKPKSVMLEHRNLVNLIDYQINQTNIDFSRVLQFATLSFDVSFQEIFTTLLAGGQLYLISKERRDNVFQLLEFISEAEITSVFMPVAYIKFIFGEAELRKKFPTRIRHIITAGEQLLVTEEFRKYLRENGIYLHNHYGPSETHVATTLTLDPNEEIPELPAIGRPVANTQIYIVNDKMVQQPIGVVGELLIAGDCVGRGYLHRPELTAEKYLANPFDPGVRLYRTGDLARWLPDGTIQFLGRADFQVKIRGFRVELGEVENQLLTHPRVKEAAVIDRADHAGNKYLCAYFVSGAEEVQVADLKAELGQRLPEYMIPTHFVQMEQIPMNANGKVDRKRLPEPTETLRTGVEYVAPTNEVEERLATIWSEVLGVEKVGIADNFFELGGHSLKATALVARVFKAFGVNLQLRQIFKTPTVEELAKVIGESEISIYANIPAVAEQEYYPLSSAQRRLFILQQLEGVNTSYHLPAVLLLEGELDRERFTWAFRQLVERHESLRTTFEFVDGEPVQRIHPEVTFELTDLGQITGQPSDQPEQVEELVRGFITPFDLGQAPLMRAGLIQYDAGYMLVFDMHHIISDGTSVNILIQEVGQLYDGQELSSLRIQYKDFSSWQNDLLQSGGMDDQEAFWLDTFQDEVPVLNLPYDYPRPAVASYEGDLINFKIDQELTSQIKEYLQAEEATLYMFLLAVYNLLLAKYSGQEDLVVGSPIAGRPHADLANILGVFINTLAMRSHPEGEKSFAQFLQEVKEDSLLAFENQDYQFEMLVEKLHLKRDLSRNPLFDVMFMLQNTDAAEKKLTGVTLKPYEFETQMAKFDLTYSAAEEAGEIICAFEYSTRLFKRETMEGMAKHLINLIRAAVTQPELQLSQLTMLSLEEVTRLTETFNATELSLGQMKPIQQLIEEQVAETPDAVALIFGDQSLTYREWNQKANQLAVKLREKGVTPNQIVGLALHRSLDLLVTLLAILKAGGAYLPIDPDYPDERINYMLTDSGAQLLLTESELVEGVNFAGETLVIGELFGVSTPDQENLSLVNTPEDLAYVIYTSGSTGKPKGVMVEHRSVHNFIAGVRDIIDFVPGMTLLSLTTISFDIFVLETWLSLSQGLKVVIGSEEEQMTPELINTALVKHQVDILQVTPSRMQLILSDESDHAGFANLKTLLVGGEAFPEQLFNKLKELTSAQILNMYGPTETTVWSTIKDLTEATEITLGQPIANTRVYILDQHQQLVPENIPGELYIAGAGLARGYLERPELTAERFIADPFQPGQLMYRTGDLAKWDASGEIHYLGRVDHQVKIRGFRIEPGEIVAELIKYPGVEEAVVVEGQDQTGNYLSAYLVMAHEPDVSSLREHLSQNLPYYMIPTYFIGLDEMPLTPNGKLHRQALPEPQGNLGSKAEQVLPRNEIESQLVELWAEALSIDVDLVGVSDSFFDLGGNSISLLKLNKLLNQKMGKEFVITDLFKYNTIEELATTFDIEEEEDDDESVKITF